MYKPKRGFQRKRTDYTGGKVGAPFKYKPEYCETAFYMAMAGFNNEEIAERIGINSTYFYEWLKKYPQLSEKIREGKYALTEACKKSALLKAKGFHEYEEREEEDEQGRKKRVRIKKYYEPDSAIIINHLNKTSKIYKDAVLESNKGLFEQQLDTARNYFEEQQPPISSRSTIPETGPESF